jgi:hypothetical protein
MKCRGASFGLQERPDTVGRAGSASPLRRCQQQVEELTMIDLPSPFAPMKDLLEALRTLEASGRHDVETRGGLELIRGYLAHRKAHPLPGDPQ